MIIIENTKTCIQQIKNNNRFELYVVNYGIKVFVKKKSSSWF